MTLARLVRMPTWRQGMARWFLSLLFLLSALGLSAFPAFAAPAHVSEANLVLPKLSDGSLATFLGGVTGWTLLSYGLLICIGGLIFGAVIYGQIRRLPVHRSMAEVSELIYETCKTYMITQGKFLLILEAFIAVIMVAYFGWVQHMNLAEVVLILAFSLIGIAGSFGVAWFGIRINTLANSRTAFASLRGQAYPVYAIPLQSGIAIGMLLISTELLIMLAILLFVSPALAGKCFIGFAIGESLGAAALRIAGGIFTKIADIGSDLMKIVFKIKEDDARNPGVIADCVGDNAGDSVGPTADGFETYGVTGVALISFIMLAVPEAAVQVQLLVWIFASPGSTGASGDITISVIDTLSLVSSGNITAGTFANGNAGTITVNAGNLLVDGQGSTDLTGITSGAYPGSTGAGGAVNIMINTLSLVNGGSISAGTFADGNAGTITVNAGNLLVDGQGSAALTGITSGVYSGSTGAGGAVNIGVANTLSLANGGSISAGTFADGNAGTITVNAGNLLVDGQGSTALTGITSGAYPGSTGAGGEIRLTVADTLSLANGGGIVAGAFSSGVSGRINISVGGAATIAGADATGRPSRLLSSAEGTGQAGDISLTTPQLSISNGGGIFATSKRTAGGNLLINADRLLLDGGQISASVFGDQKTQGGNVEINGAQLIALNGGKVTATATQGLGGRITVNTDIFLFNAATAQDVLDASSGTAGNDGAVQNNAPVTDISANFTALPVAYLDAAGQLSRRCGGNSADERSRFTVQSRGGLPPAPDEMLSAPVRRCSLPPDPKADTGSSGNTP